nr:uncharacterized protein LOC128699121 [Cherax quadricarinatus]
MKIHVRSTALLCLAALVVGVYGHGRLMDPPARNSMWRFGYPNPVNYNDNELYCGGYVVHYNKNGGRCGVCGDNYQEKTPRSHENRGIFGNGINTKNYVSGQVINIEAELTTNHKGRMEVRLCPHNDPSTAITQECFDQYPLPLEGTSDFRFIIPEDSPKAGVFTWKVKLPDGVTCSACVIQWTYFAGNTWGFDNATGEAAQGKGPQETFINCADVYIHSNTPIGAPANNNVVDNPWALYFRGSFPGMNRDVNAKPDKNGLTPLVIRAQLCLPRKKYKNIAGFDTWCMQTCLHYPPKCNYDFCYCVSECKAVGRLAEKKDADVFCHQNCLGHPSFCPSDMCECL